MTRNKNKLLLWYKKPADVWEEALPIGNGRIGGMVFGGVERERIQLNEDTLWSGFPTDNTDPKTAENLPRVRKLIFDGEYMKAQKLMEETMFSPWKESYQPLGNIYIEFDDKGPVENYRRELDLATAVARTSYTQNGANIVREVFVSDPDQVMVVNIRSDVKNGISLKAYLDSLLKHDLSVSADGTILLTGQCPAIADKAYPRCTGPAVYEEERGVRFQARLAALVQNGTAAYKDNSIIVEACDSVTFILSAASSYNGFDRNPVMEGRDYRAICSKQLDRACSKGYNELYTAHAQDYKNLFDRVELYLGSSEAQNLPTDERLEAYKNGGEDPQLAALYFQYGRYLLISSSRPGTQPANLQGIWNHEIKPPWSSNYTTNINTEMNYWPAEVCNLSECAEPLLSMVDDLRIQGAKAASVNHGCRGWTAHHNVDLWRSATGVQGAAQWAYWPMGGAWLCLHLWEHYAFSGDRSYLKKAYPVMKEAAIFMLDWMIEDKNGYLVTCPSTTPENSFITVQGEPCDVSMATTMDMSIIWELFTNCIEAIDILGMDDEFGKQLAESRARLYPYKTGKHGQLQEWFEDFEEQDVHHRHVSHLFGLHPGHRIIPGKDERLTEACKTTLIRRGDDGTGWSLAWKVNFWARLGDGDHAMKLIRRLLEPVEPKGGRGGTYPNLFDAHPPFQIDGNFGVTAAMAEMLVQSHSGVICLLPALPSVWKDGYVRGLRARGGYELDIKWEGGRLVTAEIKSTHAGICRLEYDGAVKEITIGAGENFEFDWRSQGGKQ